MSDPHIEIAELLARYARALDTKDWELFRSVFTTDAQIDYRSSGGIAGALDDVAPWLEQAFSAVPWSLHYITNIEVQLNYNQTAASVRAMLWNPMQFTGMDKPSYIGGAYHHDLVRTPDGWRSERLREETTMRVWGK